MPIAIDLNRIDISEDEISEFYPGLLETLLTDRTRTYYSGSVSHIIWGTDDYVVLGVEYAHDKPITESLVTGEHNGIIKPRILKDEELRKTRTDEKAEVFIPSFVCYTQNQMTITYI